MKIVVTGAKGQLGNDVVSELKIRCHKAVGIDIEELDITDKNAVERFICGEAP